MVRRLWDRVAMTLGAMGFVLVCGLCAFAAEPETTQEAAPTEEAKPADLAAVQEAVEMRYRRFERTLQQLSEYLRRTDPARADLLVRAIGKSKEGRIPEQLEYLTKILKKDQLGDAVDRQETLIAEMKAMLELLISEARKDEIETEKKRVQDLIKDVTKLLSAENDARADTERGGKSSELQKRQKQVSDSTEKLTKKIDAQDAAKKAAKNEKNDPNGKSSGQDGKEGTESDKKSESDEKESRNKDQSDSEKGNSDEKDGEKSDSEKKDGDEKSDADGKSKSQDGKSDSGKKSEKKSGSKSGENGQQSDQKDSDNNRDGEQKDGEKKDGDQKDEKSEDPPSDENKSDKSENGEQSENGQKQQGKSQQQKKSQKGKSQKGEQGEQPEQPSQENQDQQDSEQQENQEESPGNPQEKTPGREDLQRAKREMDRAIEELKKNNRKGASDRQDRAIAELLKAKEKLEEILRQIREEERELVLAQMEARFRAMLVQQEAVYNATLALNAVPQDDRTDRHRNRAVELARNEDEISLLAAKALTLLKEEGSSVAFPEAVEQIRDDMVTIARRLERADVGEITQNIEEDTIESLKEIIESMQKELEKLKDKKQGQQQQQNSQQQKKDEALVNQLAEMKMLRSLQYRVNRRTKQLGRLVDGEQAQDADVVNQLKQLSDRQAKVQKATYDLATGKAQ